MPLQLAGKVHLSDNNKKDQSSGNERLRSKLLHEIQAEAEAKKASQHNPGQKSTQVKSFTAIKNTRITTKYPITTT